MAWAAAEHRPAAGARCTPAAPARALCPSPAHVLGTGHCDTSQLHSGWTELGVSSVSLVVVSPVVIPQR